jgi:hypothetical protein
MKCNFILEDYRNYYGSEEFQKDLLSWFKIGKSSTNPQYPLIKFADAKFNPHRLWKNSKEKHFYFSFCVFLRNLEAQAIFMLAGREMMERFHAETGVPMFSCGLGGIMHPAHFLFEADLMPVGAEVPLYVKMIDIIMPAIKPQIEELNQYADTNELFHVIKTEIINFQKLLEQGSKPPTYLVNHI